MTRIKFTKNELRAQQHKLSQLQKYLPTLQLKKSLLQFEVASAKMELVEKQNRFELLFEGLKKGEKILDEIGGVDLGEVYEVTQFTQGIENIAGVEVPYIETLEFKSLSYSLIDTPIFCDVLIDKLRKLKRSKIEVDLVTEKVLRLQKELRDVTIRVNLFEKIMIPRSLDNIKRIKVFLSDMELAAVCQAKAAQKKVMNR